MRNIAILMTCHNRADKTINCIKSIYNQQFSEEIAVNIYLVDDGSTDGTPEKVESLFPDVKIIKGNGNLYWNRGMNIAFRKAMENDYAFYLLLNDDTLLYPNAINELISTFFILQKKHTNSKNIIVGTVKDPKTHVTTYGGYEKISKFNPLKFSLLSPNGKARMCDTMNGNVVLIPKNVSKVVGNLDPVFRHRMGDTDYALRAKKMGCNTWIAPDFVGECERNAVKGTSSDKSLSIIERFRIQLTQKGSPPKEWYVFSRRHGGPLWLFIWLSPYLKTLIPKKIK